MKAVIKRIYHHVHHAKSSLLYNFRKNNMTQSKLLDIPYFCQWESPELAGVFLKDPSKTISDPLWKNSGAKTRGEYALWSWSMCGMACLKMILTGLEIKNAGIITLGKKAALFEVYRVIDNAVEGMFYIPFVQFVKNQFELSAAVVSPMHIYDIVKSIQNEQFVIVSVSPSIRNVKIKPKATGGHLVVVTGYNLTKKQLFIHNPSGDTVRTQKNAPISFQDFNKFFAGRGIIITT